MSAKVVVRDLRKNYGDLEAARGVSFEVLEGEIFGLLGPNGAGKTTTIECVIGLREPDRGEVRICGVDARLSPREVKQKIGAALQSTALPEKITPHEALGLFGSFYRNPADPRALLERFSLAQKAHAPFDTLSGGQRQRLALALAFVNNPEVVFLDEPTAGLDPQARRGLHLEIAQMKRDGHTVLLTTHYLEEAEQLCDRVAIIDQGRVIEAGTPREVIARSTASPSVLLVTAEPIRRESLADIPGVQDVVLDGVTVRFRTADVSRTLAAVMATLDSQGIEVAELQMRKATLEDVLIELTGRASRG